MTTDATKLLGDISGLGQDEVRAIWRQVQENAAKLKGCPGPHRFRQVESLGSGLKIKHECEQCGGRIDGVVLSWYVAGYVAAGGKREDVVAEVADGHS